MEKIKKQRIILTAVLISYFLIIMSNSVIFTGVVNIQRDLSLSAKALPWVSNSYSLTFGGLLLLAGRLGDIFEKKLIFIIGIVVFGISSLLVGIANTSGLMILARAVQGIGASIIAPTSSALLLDTFAGAERTKAIALYGATAGIGSSVGLVVGGLFASLWTWRIGFLINFPIAAVLLYLVLKYVSSQAQHEGSKIDFGGSLLSILAVASILYAMTADSNQLIFLAIGIVLLIAFIVLEKKISRPIMPITLFQDPERIGAYIARFFYMAAMMSFWFFTPQLMQNTMNFTPLWVGFGFFPMTMVMYIVAMRLPIMTEKIGNARILRIGMVLTLLGMIWVCCFQSGFGYWFGIAAPMILVGAGQSMVISPLTVSGVVRTRGEESGAASGLVNAVHQIGGAVGLALITLLAGSIGNQVFRYRISMIVATVLVGLAYIATLLLVRIEKND
ncbi:MFS transporter [Oenococcus kitaharae]|uniref:Permease of the major facilitator superfamily n=2 Tax=Oenococcus TaxID=46254 RepID=G9WJJ5_9LACO|nr:MFS transporter [Oenococcus kitaharae]EHN59040.1 permease of the major facilitator superfamily [Oenococcus kitaharae DSM 17330]OEY83734.1 MFS transporter permease [Oenococcus kitaharae]OEY83906.1 MFS transporter permease [Oenococcus kitaharae]OEY84182.1 MFS transporter permease [Oenococcus kitaharae]